MSTIQAYPLSWPFGVPRTLSPSHNSHFGDRSIAQARDALTDELKRMGARDVVISSNVKPNRDGEIPYDARAPKDAGVAVYFKHKDRMRSFSCDRWRTLEQNLYALALTIEAMRGLQRWGCSDMDRAFQGFAALPPPSDGSGSPWWEVLKCARIWPLQDIETQYRVLAKKMHPDAGGSTQAMANLSRAIEEARKEKLTRAK